MYTRPRQPERQTETVNARPDDSSAYPTAGARTLADLAGLVRQQDDLRAQLRSVERKISVLRPLAAGLLSQCTPEERESLARDFELPGLLGEQTACRGGNLLREVLGTFRSGAPAPFGAGDVIAALEDRGVACSSKAVYNAIQRLALNGQLVRVSRGRYLAPGYGFAVDAPDGLQD